MTASTRPPTVTEAVAWLKRSAEYPDYCLACLRLWKASMGIDAAKTVFNQAPDSVRKWINERSGK